MSALKVVSFVNDNVENSKDLNSLFVLPIKLKEVSDKTKLEMMKELSEKYKSTDWINNELQRFDQIQIINSLRNIYGYLDQNILDLYRTSVVNFCATYLSKYLGEIIYDDISIPENMTISRYLSSTGSLYDIPVMDNNLIYTLLDQGSDVTIRNIAILYNEYIYSIIIRLMNTGRIVELYEDYYKTIYNEDPTDYSPSFVYTFCISIMRDQIEIEVMKIREAMVIVMNNACAVMMNNPNDYSLDKKDNYVLIDKEKKDGNS